MRHSVVWLNGASESNNNNNNANLVLKICRYILKI